MSDRGLASPNRMTAVETSSLAVGLGLAYSVLLVALAIDLALMVETPLLAEGRPEFDAVYLLRTALVAAGSATLVVTVLRHRNSPGIATAAVDKPPERMTASWVAVILGLGFALLFAVDPVAFHRLAREDRAIEFGSAALCFASALVLMAALRRSRVPARSASGLMILGLVVALLLIGLEELSWFQRLAAIETPAPLQGRARSELNLHNLATDQVENLYYFSGFAFLVMLPFLGSALERHLHRFGLTKLIPGPGPMAVGAIATAYNYDMWNSLVTQASFFLTVFILVGAASRPDKSNWRRYLVPAVCALVQTLFLAFGDRFVRLWDVTEYKEFLLPLAFFLYSLQLHRAEAAAQPNSSFW